MNRILTLCLLPFTAVTALAGEPSPRADLPASSAPAADWLTGENVSLGGVLFPHMHFQSAYGWTSSRDGHEFGSGHHDPVEDGWTVQGLELGLSGRWSEYFHTFAAWHGYWENTAPNDFDHEFEEYFGELRKLPGGFTLRGGRFLNRFGLHNATHQHGWDWMDNYLVNGRFLGDDGLYSRGGELSWTLPVKWTSVISFSAGRAITETHEHEEEEGADEPLIEAHGAAFTGTFYTMNWTTLWELNDFHAFRGGLSAAWGDNEWDRTSLVTGAHLQYDWRQNGAGRGGNFLRWRTEVLLRDINALTHEDEEPASFDEWGFYSSMTYGFDLPRGTLEASLRGEWVEGTASAALPQRTRISPGLTWVLNDSRNAWLRLQYSRDHIEDHGNEDSVWLGIGLNWGGAEVR